MVSINWQLFSDPDPFPVTNQTYPSTVRPFN